MKLNCSLHGFIRIFHYVLIGFLVPIFFSVSIGLAIYQQQDRPRANPDQSDIKEIVRLLEVSPAWDTLKDNSSLLENQNMILENLFKISKYDLTTIRGAISFFVEKKKSTNEYNVSNMSRLFLLNRYIFNIPESIPFDAPAFGGWVGVPIKNKIINRLWPLTVNKDGVIMIDGEFGGYFGPDYRAVEEFDYFQEKFATRSFKH